MYRYAARDHLNVSGDGRGAMMVPNRGGHQTRLIGGLAFKVIRGHNLGLQANYLLDADLNGDQLTARMEYIVGWQGTFGAHRHPVQ